MKQWKEQQPVVAHANGVDGKEYFLRDRGLWFIDDFEKRFEEQQRFLTYNHPTGMSHHFEKKPKKSFDVSCF